MRKYLSNIVVGEKPLYRDFGNDRDSKGKASLKYTEFNALTESTPHPLSA
jgi:hypothetical protein